MSDVLTWVAAIYLLIGVVLSAAPFIRDSIALEFQSHTPSLRWRVIAARAVLHLGMVLGWPVFIRGAVADTAWAGRPSVISAIWTALRSYSDPDTHPRFMRVMRAKDATDGITKMRERD